MPKQLIILGKSRSGKDTIAKALGWDNRKFSKWAKDWVDSTFGGEFESTRYQEIAPGKTKLDLLIELYHLLKPYHASVNFAANNWQFPVSQNTCYTDVRTEAEMSFLVTHNPDVLVLPCGIHTSSDCEFDKILDIAESYDLPIQYWQFNHPASYNAVELTQLLEEYGYETNRDHS